MGHTERPITLVLEVPEKERDGSNIQRGNSQRVPKLKKDTNIYIQDGRMKTRHACRHTQHTHTHTCTHVYIHTTRIISKVQKTKDKKKIVKVAGDGGKRHCLQKNSKLSRNATWENHALAVRE